MKPADELLLDHRARADSHLVDDQLTGSHAECDAIAPLQRRERLVAGGDGVDTERARGRVRVELTDRPPQEIQELFDGGQVAGTLRWECSLVPSRFRFVIGERLS